VIADLYKLEEQIPARFRARSQWFANKIIWNKVAQFNAGGAAGVWLPNLGAGFLNTDRPAGNTGYGVIGYAANECSGLDAVLTAGSEIIVAGDPQYFVIVDRVGLNIEVVSHIFDSSTWLPKAQRGIYALWRNTSQVINANAFRTLLT
jgi:HK97 family phage major capsid protein